MRKWVWLSITLAALSTGYAAGYFVKTPPGAGGMTVAGVPMPPPVKAYSEGGEIRFAHTEASDTKVAKLLTEMMRSPVLVVPSLAQAPESMLATVYVFKNGVTGGGPLGFQPDVFDNPPGTNGYSPLRALNLVTWKTEQSARELKSAAEVQAAEAKGEVTIEEPGVVVNMPMLTWPGGQR
ncbi:MAG: hypothetical protein HY576_05570 [candidate division NC10 bacterium]|nr:hypothetical protein [candidate division NC10 bacterium]